MKKRKLYKIAFMGDKDHGCDIISTLESWGGSNYFSRIGNDPEYAYFINDLGTIDLIHNSAFLSEEMKNFYFLFWHDYSIECHLKVGESINYGGQDYDVDSILFDANNRCIVYKLKSFGIGVEYITNNELTPTEECQREKVNNKYLRNDNMETKLAIKGHATRGKEVIKLLEMMGGKNKYYYKCNEIRVGFTIGSDGRICRVTYNLYDEFRVFTLEEFLEKYPFKVGDKVADIADGYPGIITAMKWDEDVSDMKYRVAFDNGDMGWYTNDTIKFLKKDEKLKKGKAMNKKLAIKGHSTRGKEVIELLEMIGGINDEGYIGTNTWKDEYYFLDNGCIHAYDWCDGIKFTLEEFLEKYPFKVGDKVFLYDNITEGCVTGMEWDEDKGTVKYCVYTSIERWCDVKELLEWNKVPTNKDTNMNDNKFGSAKEPLKLKSNAVKLVDGNVVDEMEICERFKNHKMGPKSKLPSKYYEDRLEETQSKRDIDKSEFMIKHMILPNKVDDKLEYKIPDGLEFDVVVDGKIILKPIKPKYPKTYVECCEIMRVGLWNTLWGEDATEYEEQTEKLINAFIKLKVYRDAYWKIAGEQMGLGKLWEPDWNDEIQKYCIRKDRNKIVNCSSSFNNRILAFPTEEMRDTFYENFKDLIEECKELL